jgi:hypothetical protein
MAKQQHSAVPVVERIEPSCVLPGGDLRVVGQNLKPPGSQRPRVEFGGEEALQLYTSGRELIVRIPEAAAGNSLRVTTEESSEPVELCVATLLSAGLHPITNPAVDAGGGIFTTFSGARGEAVPIAIFRLDSTGEVMPFVAEMMNASGLAFGATGDLYVSSRHNGEVYRVTPAGAMRGYAKGLGIATGLAFDKENNLYVGDRSGTIFKIAPDRQIYVFATLEPSISAYHLAFDGDGQLYVTGPTVSSYNNIWRIAPDGAVSIFFRGLGRPQGMAFETDGNLLVAASHQGRRGVFRITPQGEISLLIAGRGIVGLAFLPGGGLVLTTTDSVYKLDCGLQGRPLP